MTAADARARLRRVGRPRARALPAVRRREPLKARMQVSQTWPRAGVLVSQAQRPVETRVSTDVLDLARNQLPWMRCTEMPLPLFFCSRTERGLGRASNHLHVGRREEGTGQGKTKKRVPWNDPAEKDNRHRLAILPTPDPTEQAQASAQMPSS